MKYLQPTFFLALATSLCNLSPVKSKEVAETDTETLHSPFLAELNEFFNPHFPTAFFDSQQLGFRRLSPRYDVFENDKTFQVSVVVPGFHFHEVTVNVGSGGRTLLIHGEKESHTGDRTISSHFEQTFTLDPSVESDKITANLADGVLTVTAPRGPLKLDHWAVPITQFDSDALKEIKEMDETK
jgi:HSP20 family protein